VITPQEAIEVIRARFGYHPGYRALHAKGVFCEGTFTATPAAAKLTRAPHMQGDPVPAIVRFSNGGGDPNVPDYAPDVRGMAVSFELPDGSRTDIVAQTAPHFPFRTPDEFIEFVRLSKPGLSAAIRLPLFLARHPHVARTLRANLAALAPPASFAARPYYAIHAFKWIAADGSERWVRYTWRPHDRQRDLSRAEARRRGRHYLFDDLALRLQTGPIRFNLDIQVITRSEDPHDPTAAAPNGPTLVPAGTLVIIPRTEASDGTVFDPTRVCDGIDLSNDPILRFRPNVYAISHAGRAAD
jgi:catalase